MTETKSPNYYESRRKDSFDGGTADIKLYFDSLRAESGTLYYGPEYMTRTSGNQEVSIATYYSQYKIHPDDSDETLIMIARNSAGAIVGYRMDDIHYREELYEMDGRIESALGTKGVATTIELAHFDVLSRLANIRNTEILYSIRDLNKGVLESIKGYVAQFPMDVDKQRVVESKALERERWMGLYGPQGKLGFDEKGQKVFRPEVALINQPFELIDSIELRRKEIVDEGRMIIVPEVQHVVLSVAPDLLRARKEAVFKSSILPQIQAKKFLTE